MSILLNVSCPTCGKSVTWLPENSYRPFCSQRCKLIDLGAWVDEDYTLAAEDHADFPSADILVNTKTFI